jgi:hypothetical protein
MRIAPFSMMPRSDIERPQRGADPPRKVITWPTFFIKSMSSLT